MRSSGPSPTTWYAMFRSPLFVYRVSGVADGIEPPLGRPARQLVCATILEIDVGAGSEVLNRSRNQHLAGGGGGRHSGADVHGEACDILPHALALAGVDPCTDFEAELGNLLDDRARDRDIAASGVADVRQV